MLRQAVWEFPLIIFAPSGIFITFVNSRRSPPPTVEGPAWRSLERHVHIYKQYHHPSSLTFAFIPFWLQNAPCNNWVGIFALYSFLAKVGEHHISHISAVPFVPWLARSSSACEAVSCPACPLFLLSRLAFSSSTPSPICLLRSVIPFIAPPRIVFR